MKSAIFSKPLPYLALIVAHLIWGVNFVVAKVTLEEFPPQSLAFLRFFLAFLLLAPFFLAHTHKSLPKNLKIHLDSHDLPKLVAVGIFIITLNITFFFEGMKRTSAIDASVLSLITPILSVLIGWWFLKEKVYFFNVLGVLAGLAGAIIIIGLPQIIVGNYSPEVLLGNVFIVLAAISFVIGATFSRQLLKKYPSILVTAFAFLVGSITFIIPAILEYVKDPTWINQISPLGIVGLTYMTLLSSISAYLLFEWGLSKTNLTIADLFQYIEPFVAAAAAILILHERISFSFVVGTVLIGLGVYWGTFAKEAHHRLHKYHRH